MKNLGTRLAAVGLASLALACSHDVTSPTPALQAVAPDLACNGPSVTQPGGVTAVTLTGSDFTPMPSKTLSSPRELILPSVTLSPVAALPGGQLPGAPVAFSGLPTDPTASSLFWTSETQMGFYVNPADMDPAGVFDITVTNPDKHRQTTLAQSLAIIPPPVVTAASPMAICDEESNQTVDITGTSFLVYAGETPTVTIAAPGGAKTYQATFAAADCQAIPGTFSEQDVELCTKISITIPAGDLVVTANTMVSLVVTNPPPADCASSTGFDITLDAPPEVDSVVPSTMCQGGGVVTINGSNFAPNATVELVCPSGTYMAGSVTVNQAGTQISASFAGGAAAGETCDVVVKNPDGCDDRPLPHKQVHITTGPIAFLVDPNVVYNGINTVVTIYSTTLVFPVQVSITPSGGGTPTMLTTLARDPNHPNRVQAIVPMGQGVGTYDITVSDGQGCPTLMPAGLRVVDVTSKTVTLLKVSPPFGQTGTDTAVEIFRDKTATTPNDTLFEDTPRVFLNPHSGTASAAVALEAVTWLDGDRVTGIVPAATPANDYDVILVNPDGTVGVLSWTQQNGYTETSTAPPEIDSATPSSIKTQTAQHVTLAGKNFDASDTVSIACETSAGAAETAPAVTSTAPSCTGASCTQAITIDGSGLAIGSVCVVTVTNSDGSYGVYSAIGVTNTSLNLSLGAAGLDMNVGRRALSAASGNATAVNRFIYAIGGDDGTGAAGAMSSVEFVAVDPFGQESATSPWVIQPNALRANRTLADAVTIGRYIYIAGGNDGTGPVATAERALILSPSESPEITDLDAQLATTGLAPGVYRYRVAAVFSSTDPDNPDGESLASDELTVNVPTFQNKQLQLTVIWRAPVDSQGATLPNIVGYRIYRTQLGGATGSEQLLGTTTAATPTTFLDDGSVTPAGATPLPLGSTGKWAALPAMASAREGVALAAGADPTVPGTYYVYALLGRSSSTTALTSYEYLAVTTAANGHQTVGAAWTAGTAQAASGRWQARAWTVDATVSSIYSGSTEIFVGGGLTASGGTAGKVEAGAITTGGQLVGALASTVLLDDAPTDFSTNAAGYGVCAANGQLYAFGGVSAAPSGGARSATLDTTIPALAPGAWNNEGIQLLQKRYLMGSTVKSAFIFLLGGDVIDPTTAVETTASKTTEQVIW